MMRMLSSMDSRVRFRSFNSLRAVIGDYAVLSHVWNGVEQSYQEIARLERAGVAVNDARLCFKVRECLRLAQVYRCPWVWMDAPCIDKRSSADISESIRSMFKWYSHSSVCFAYLADVPSNSDPIDAPGSAFRRSKYFLRGWTLQELIAPRRVVFLAKDWTVLGDKHDLAGLLEEITGIDADVLTFRRSLSDISVARRLSWASRRETSLPEDMAYCLMGLFDIHMPVLYGEGDAAFGRLQEAILQKVRDHTLLAWDIQHPRSPSPESPYPPSSESPWPFAPSPTAFARASHLIPVDIQQFVSEIAPLCEAFDPHYTVSSIVATFLSWSHMKNFKILPSIGPADHNGIKCHLPVFFRGPTPCAAILACREAQSPSSYIALALHSNCPSVPGVFDVGVEVRRTEASTMQERATPRLLRVNVHAVASQITDHATLAHDVVLQHSAWTLRFVDLYITSASPSSPPPAHGDKTGT